MPEGVGYKNVRIPSGAIIAFPGDMPDEEINTQIRAFLETQGPAPSTFTRTGEPISVPDLSMTDIGGGERSPYEAPIAEMMGSAAAFGGAGGAVAAGLRAGVKPTLAALARHSPRILRNMGLGGLIGASIEGVSGGNVLSGAKTGAVMGALGSTGRGGTIKDLVKGRLVKRATTTAARKTASQAEVDAAFGLTGTAKKKATEAAEQLAKKTLATTSSVEQRAIVQFAKDVAKRNPKVGEKIWMELKDGVPVRYLTPDQAGAAARAGKETTWVKNLWG